MHTWNNFRLKPILESPSPLPKCAGVMWSDVVDRLHDQSPLASACHRADEQRDSRQEASGEDYRFVSKRDSCSNGTTLTLQ